MHRTHLVPLLAAVLGVAAAPARPARADGNALTSVVGQIFLLSTLATTATLGTATDIGLGISLGRTGRAPRLLSLGGLALWTVTTAVYVTLLVVDDEVSPVTVSPATVMASAACAGSLALSAYGLTRPLPAPTLAPAASRTGQGALAPGLAVVGRW